MKKYLYWVLIEVMTNKDNTKQWYRVNAANDDEAVKKVAKERGVPKNEIYKIALDIEE